MLYLLPQAIDRAAERDPERPAFVCRGAGLTYAELSRRSNALAWTLVNEGVRRGDRVGIFADKSLETAVAVHGVMKAGAAYVPLDPDAPTARVAHIIASCGMRHIVSDDSRRAGLEALAGLEGTSLECIIGPVDTAPWRSVSWSEVDAARGDVPPDAGTMEQDLAYVLFTSGSTGTPKGIMHTHRSALSWAEVTVSTYGFGPEDRLSNHAPLYFDLSTLDYFSAAVAGATTVMVPKAHTRVPASLSKLMEDERLTVFYCVPFALVQLLLHGALSQRELGSLRWILFGGEPFPPKHLRALMQELPAARFCNVYGPTETNGCTHFPVQGLDEDDDEPLSIGAPYPNVEALVVDAGDRPVGVGETGELLIRAPTRMRGYWRDPELTERATFRRELAGSWDVFHRTGDLVETRPDGNFRFLGRKDRQVKVRGHRIELDEVEAALAAHDDVAEAAVYLVRGDDANHAIRAAATVRSAVAAASDELEAHLRRLLPAYAIPERVEIVESFPRTATGKIDRRRLSEGAESRALSESE